MEGVKREFIEVPKYKSNYILMDESHKYGVKEARHMYYMTCMTLSFVDFAEFVLLPLKVTNKNILIYSL